jgi:hypothetical protein
MLSFPAAIKVRLCTVACNRRCSFDGRSAACTGSLSGHSGPEVDQVSTNEQVYRRDCSHYVPRPG